jgi:uncharacterized surface protein with fasciclin (FAS1) repeats
VKRTRTLLIALALLAMLAGPATVAADPGSYTVQRGDTLGGIARALGVPSYMHLVEATNARHQTDPSFAFIENPNLIYAGWKLAVPGGQAATLLDQAEALDPAVKQTDNLATLGIFDLVAPSEASLAGRPQETIDLIGTQLPSMYQMMVDTLKGQAAYTLFLPTGDGWARLSDAQLQTLANDGAIRTQVWQHHIVSGRVTAADLTDGAMLTALDGGQLAVARTGDQITINGLPLVRADLQPPTGQLASRGLLHVVDGILLPGDPVAAAPGRDYTVVGGDTLFKIAARLLGDGRRYMEIIELTNSAGAGYATIVNPDLIHVGWVLAVPGR